MRRRDHRPVLPPAPRPPVAARPRRLSVTRIETWMRDPYTHLSRARSCACGRSTRWRRIPARRNAARMVHDALDAFLRRYPDVLPPDAEERLDSRSARTPSAGAGAARACAPSGGRASCRIARWFVDQERQERHGHCDKPDRGHRQRMKSGAPGGPFVLSAHADRIDRQTDGALSIIDYKTGTVPSEKQIKAGYAPQLPLEAVIAEAGGFEGVPACRGAAARALATVRRRAGRRPCARSGKTWRPWRRRHATAWSS